MTMTITDRRSIELRDDLLDAVYRSLYRRPDITWDQIVAGLEDATRIVQEAAATDTMNGYRRARAILTRLDEAPPTTGPVPELEVS